MFENITGLQLKGGRFDTQSTLELFPHAINILYGKNGCGKSTIARAFRQIATSSSDLEVAELVGPDSATTSHGNSTKSYNHTHLKTIPLNDDALSKIYVFDQYFIDHNVSIHSLENGKNGLNAIVRIGAKSIELNDKIQTTQKQIANVNKEIQQSDNAINLQTQMVNELQSAMHEELKRKWFVRESEIVGDGMGIFNSKRALEAVSKYPTESQSIEALKIQYHDQLRLYREALGGTHLDWVGYLKGIDLDHIQQLLSGKITTDVATELRNFSLKAVVNYGHIANIDYFKYLCEECDKGVSRLNSLLLNIQRNISNRLAHPDTPYIDSITQYPIDDCLAEVNASIRDINRRIDKYNDALNHIPALRGNLHELNNRIGALEIAELQSHYDDENRLLKGFTEQLHEHQSELNKLEKKFQDLKKQQVDKTDAMADINNSLAYIYCSTNRMKLVLNRSDDSYQILVRNNPNPVSPTHISTGERNIIALCYFFAALYEKESSNNLYKQERLVIIDDPITSFDSDSRIGVMSFLHQKIYKILDGNPSSKILLMSHDRQTVADLYTLAQGMKNQWWFRLQQPDESKDDYWDQCSKAKEKWMVLEGNSTSVTTMNKNEGDYKRMLQAIYTYAVTPIDQIDDYMDITIGNLMRRALEMYLSFNYQLGVSHLSNSDILGKIPRSERSFYQNRMIKILLHTESHSEDKAKSEIPFQYEFTREEKQSAAKEILRFLYLLDQIHVKRMCGEKAFNTIATWGDAPSDEQFSKREQKSSAKK